jgi:hypothetical protein
MNIDVTTGINRHVTIIIVTAIRRFGVAVVTWTDFFLVYWLIPSLSGLFEQFSLRVLFALKMHFCRLLIV